VKESLMMTFRQRTILLSAVTLFILFAAFVMRMYPSHSTVFASGNWPVSNSLILSPTYGPPTATVIVTGSGYGPMEKVLLKVYTVVVGSIVTDTSGSFSSSITIPASATPGKHPIYAAGLTSRTSAHAPFVVQADWPQQNYDAQNTSFNPYENVLSPSTVSGLTLDWQHCLMGMSCPPRIEAITSLADANGLLYAVGNHTVSRLWALRLTTGGRIWASGPIHRQNFSAPALANGMLYYGTGGGNSLLALDAVTGRLRWSYRPDQNVVNSPTVANGLVYIIAPGGQILGSGPRLIAFDAATGLVRWNQFIKLSSSPIAVSSTTAFVCSKSKKSTTSILEALDALTGSLLWSFPQGCGLLRFANNIIYVSTGSTLYALDAATGATLWTSQLGTVKAIANGVLYVVSNTQTLYALDASTGNMLWQFPLSCNVFALANGVLFGTSANTLCAVDATTGSLLWSYTIANATWTAQPIVVNGKVYTSAGGYIYAFGLPRMTS
jgi:outer membrane protein assembly factor BamB